MSGILVLVPSWADKKKWFDNLPKKYAKYWINGDELLEKLGISNQTDIWYDYSRKKEMKIITDKLHHSLKKGLNVMYTANPHLIKADVIIFPPITKDVKVETLQLNRERLAFTTATATFVINSDIPDVKTLHKLSKYCENL